MDDPRAAGTTPASMLDAGAHAMRNDIATLRMAARLVDDVEVSGAMGEALDDLQVRLERAVVAARIELERRPEPATITAGDLLRFGRARATREGLRDDGLAVRIDASEVTAPGPWAERLVADLLHRAGDDWIAVLAGACGATVTHEDAGVTVRFGSGT